MDNRDPQLSELLKQWPDIEPRPAFTQDVLRRLRLETVQPQPAAWWDLPPAWLITGRRLAGAATAALVFAFVLGLLATLMLPPPVSRSPANALAGFSVLNPGTLAGNYVTMTGDR